jgi:hypothetical protein
MNYKNPGTNFGARRVFRVERALFETLFGLD